MTSHSRPEKRRSIPRELWTNLVGGSGGEIDIVFWKNDSDDSLFLSAAISQMFPLAEESDASDGLIKWMRDNNICRIEAVQVAGMAAVGLARCGQKHTVRGTQKPLF